MWYFIREHFFFFMMIFENEWNIFFRGLLEKRYKMLILFYFLFQFLLFWRKFFPKIEVPHFCRKIHLVCISQLKSSRSKKMLKYTKSLLHSQEKYGFNDRECEVMKINNTINCLKEEIVCAKIRFVFFLQFYSAYKKWWILFRIIKFNWNKLLPLWGSLVIREITLCYKIGLDW